MVSPASLLQLLAHALGMLALASQFRKVLGALAGFTAVMFTFGYNTATGRVGALLRLAHLKVPLTDLFDPPFLSAGWVQSIILLPAAWI